MRFHEVLLGNQHKIRSKQHNGKVSVFPFGVILAGYLYILVDAVKTARRQRETFHPKFYNRWYVYLTIIVLGDFVIQPTVSATIQGWMQAFKIPAASMTPTLLVGDHILVNKLRYRWAPPQRLDVIVFQYPWEAERAFVERVIGLPGDRVLVRDGQVFVNDQPVQEPYAHSTASSRHETFGPVVVPHKGDRLEIHSDQRLYLNGDPVPIPSGLFHPRSDQAPMSGLEVFYGALLPPGTTLEQPLAPHPVAQDYYFVLGDNRDNSQDSRYWGFVPRATILGPAQRLYWSWDRDTAHVRWERIGQSIR